MPGVDWAQQCAAVMPCYNEGRTIAGLVRAVRLYLPHVWVVDDGSRDDVAEQAAGAGARVIRHAANQGKGAALQTGLRAAWSERFRWGLTLDGDGQHRPAEIPAFLARWEQTRAPLVVGNRMANARAMPRTRRHVNRWMSRQLSRLAGQPLPDSQCGYRLMELAAWSRLPISARHFEIESDLLLAFARAGHPIDFVPIPVIHQLRPSRIQPLKDTWRWLRWWGRQHGITGAAQLPQTRPQPVTALASCE